MKMQAIDVQSKEDIMSWLMTRAFSDLLNYDTYQHFLDNVFYIEANLTQNRIVTIEAGAFLQEMADRAGMTFGTDYDAAMQMMGKRLLRSVQKKEVRAFFDRQSLTAHYEQGEPYRSIQFQRRTGDDWRWVRACCGMYREEGETDLHAYFITYDFDTYRRDIDAIHRMAERDGLTNLYNRNTAMDKISDYLENTGTAEGEHAILMTVDIDDFKLFNDRFGHEFGDEVLRHLARRLEHFFDYNSVLSRLGGDEFLVFAMDVDEASGKQQIEAFLNSDNQVTAGEVTADYHVSVGYAVYPEQGTSYDGLFGRADQALYAVKMDAKGSARKYTEEMKAIERDQLAFNLGDVAAGMPGAILIYKADAEERILFASDELVRIFECDSLEDFLEYTNYSFRSIVHPDDLDEVERSIWDQINYGNGNIDYVRYRVITKKGNIKHIEDFGHLVHSQFYGDIFYVFIHDLRNKEMLLNGLDAGPEITTILEENTVDLLTGLNDMHYLRACAPSLIKDIRRKGRMPVIIYFNIQNFKAYNETYGFGSGDRILKSIATILSDTFVQNLVCRLSDDHFAVITEQKGVEERINEVHSRVHHFEKGLAVEIKAGIFVVKDDVADVSVACDHAKLACDHIKRNYGESFCYYDAAMDERLHMQKYIVEHIDEAMENGQIEVYLQPIIDVLNGGVVSMEALTRWKDPHYGMISPGIFIDILEDYRLVHKLDYHILEQVCRIQKEREAQGKRLFPISLNLSRLDFELLDIVQMTENVVTESKLDKSLIEIEITESAVTMDSEFLRREVDRFKEHHFAVWMDDFGSGYSSLNVLQDYNFDVIKLDMRFLRSLGNNPKSGMIISSVIEMTKKLCLKTLVEGVETQEQYAFLKEHGCDYAQGYLFGKPVHYSEVD